MYKNGTNLVQSFRHSVPYINMHRNKKFVIFLTGEAIYHSNFSNIINDIGLLHSLGIRIVIVFSIIPQIDVFLEKMNLKCIFYNNIRITTPKILNYIKKISGQLQLEITARLSLSISNTPLQGANINVVSGNFIIAQPFGIVKGIDYFHTGKVRRINYQSINQQLLNNNAVVLVSPVASSVTGECFNLNSEEIANNIAVKIQAEKLISFSQHSGIIDYKNQRIYSEIISEKLEKYIENKKFIRYFSNQYLRFLKCAVNSCKKGVSRIHIISYQKKGALLEELFSSKGIGTQILIESSESIIPASINDIGGILNVIKPLEIKGILVRRSREQLEIEIHNFIVIKKDNLVIACVALYPFLKEKIGELACLAVHPDYQSVSRGELLLNAIIIKAKKICLQKIFVLTTHSIHWFQERGFVPVNINVLPDSKKKMYNYKRGSKVLIINI
ncbi:amino-acid N-acetyltransferase [Buchnera aphidicola (Thelaxes californica)]|uniref:Amino-acid acetyltransferase n=1 Tax=Buchnera aphidicola (Thelaxes californica) TaxID=1315998 RepID=A0A4D6YLM8_9GAMM|nr:amino-acid N-acetyltransferase [Buchnera aphidicola]QCI26874.1 amino-acid N-acetyltransferase [Buchnera aphidicola (Thelaxes californica)]